MLNLSSYLEKFKNIKDPKENKTITTTTISQVVGVEIKEGDITIQKNNIYIQGSSVLKNRIFLKKEILIKTLNECLVDLQIKDIL